MPNAYFETDLNKSIENTSSLLAENIERAENYLYSLQGIKDRKITNQNQNKKPINKADR